LDAITCEQLDSDKDLNAFTEPPKHERAAHAANISGAAAPQTLSSSNSFETLLVEESSDDDEDGSFKSRSGSESSDNSDDESTPDLEPISHDKV
jgi:hypothetical protein